MKKVLMIAPYFPPRRRVGSLRPFRFAVNLPSFGWQPMVATLKTASGSLTAIEKGELAGIDICTLNSWFDRSEVQSQPDPRRRTPNQEISTRSVRNNTSQCSFKLRSVPIGFDHAFPIDTWLPVLMFHYHRMARYIEQQRPRVIWSTADPWSSHILALRLAKKFKLPWIADFRDPWTLCSLRSNGRRAFAKKCDQWAERKILKYANRVVFTAKQTQRNYESHFNFPISATTIYNTFDHTDGHRDAMPRSRNRNLDLVFFGKFRELSPATRIIDILQQLKDRYPEVFPFVRIHSFGPLETQDLQHAQEAGVYERFFWSVPIRPEDSTKVLRRFDILLLSADLRRNEIIPAKLWDYLAAGRPVLSICANPEVQNILTEVQSGIQVESCKTAADLLADCWRAKCDWTKLPIPFNERSKAVESYNAFHTTSALVEIFESL